MTQRQKCSKTAVEVEKKVTTFGENIRPGQFDPYVIFVVFVKYKLSTCVVSVLYMYGSCGCIFIRTRALGATSGYSICMLFLYLYSICAVFV